MSDFSVLNIVPVGEPEEMQPERSAELPGYAEALKKIPLRSQQRYDVPTGKPQYRRIPERDESGNPRKVTQQDGSVVTVFQKNEDGSDKMEATKRGLEEVRFASLFEQAGKLAERVFPKPTDEARIAEAYRLLYGRAPTKQEVDIGLGFLKTTPESAGNTVSGEPITAWREYARVLLSANEFEFVD